MRPHANENEGVTEFGSAFPACGEALELVEEGEGLLDDVAEFCPGPGCWGRPWAPGWLSPECYQDGTTGPPGDFFAWVALLAFAATGRHPFSTGNAEAVAFRVLGAEPDLAGVPDGMLSLVTACLAKDLGCSGVVVGVPGGGHRGRRCASVSLGLRPVCAVGALPLYAEGPCGVEQGWRAWGLEAVCPTFWDWRLNRLVLRNLTILGGGKLQPMAAALLIGGCATAA